MKRFIMFFTALMMCASLMLSGCGLLKPSEVKAERNYNGSGAVGDVMSFTVNEEN
ncbi:hypothetical protein HOH87_03200 [bacterium]|jgi:hypothetical protein|nr:hypothetical protein [bacterium]